jgi:hypothetical protein
MARTSPITKPCDHCGTVFTARYQWAQKEFQKYCGRPCYQAAIRYTTEKTLEVMWAQIDRNGPGGCWIWRGSTNNMGYGSIQFNGRKMVAVHRLIYQLAHGNLEGPHVFCLHKCDTPRCVNPEHIFLGDDKANTADKVAKKRHLYGERNSHARLTEAQVLVIRAEYWYDPVRNRSNILELVAKYGVSRITLSALISGRSWKHLPGARKVRPSLRCEERQP